MVLEKTFKGYICKKKLIFVSHSQQFNSDALGQVGLVDCQPVELGLSFVKSASLTNRSFKLTTINICKINEVIKQTQKYVFCPK